MNDPIIYAFDPGDTTGWSKLDWHDGTELEHGTVKFDDMPEFLWLRQSELDYTRAVVVEDFRLFKHLAVQQSGSKFDAVAVIGMLRLWIYPPANTKFVLQPPSIKPIAQKFSGRVPKGAHSKSHDVDAYNHGIFYLKQLGNFKTELERRSEH